VESKNVKNRDELEWERQLQAELEKKRGIKHVDPETVAKLEAEERIRSAVSSQVRVIQACLQAISAVAKRCPVTTHDFILSAIMRPLHALLKSPLVMPDVRRALAALAASIDGSLQQLGGDLAAVITTCVVAGPRLFEPSYADRLTLLHATLYKIKLACMVFRLLLLYHVVPYL